MRSLFLKIFLSYWIALALFVVLAIVVTLAVRPQDSPRFEYFRGMVANEAVQAYEQGGIPELRSFFSDLQKALHDHAFLFDDKGQEISGNNAPGWARQLALGIRTRPGGLWQSERRAAQAVAGASGRRYILVLEHPGPPPHIFFGPGRMPGLGIFIAILTSGLVCFLLARSLTAPITRLRAATQRLANGDLKARAGAVGSRDEIAELVRDFDRMAERLENLVNAQSRLLNDISHELRSPLARLSVALGLARQRTGPEAAATLDRIESEANRLNELIGRLLTLARMEGNEQAIARSPVDLAEVVTDIAEDATFEAQGRNCRVKYAIVQNSTVLGSSALLRSAIENVVRNAMRYTAEGTEVEIQLDRVENSSGSEAVIRVSDRGPGVPQESLDKLFRPFYRLDDARERQTGGVGLGLAITERAVRLHGGSACAVNRPSGGLQVEIRLPVLSGSANMPPPTATKIPVLRS